MKAARTLAILALALALSARAEPTTAPRALPFHGKIAAVDGSEIVIGKIAYNTTPETKITKDGQPSTLDAATVGDTCGGSAITEPDGTRRLRSLRIGPAPAKVSSKPAKK